MLWTQARVRWKASRKSLRAWLLTSQLVLLCGATTTAGSVLVEAHRGYSGIAPENTIASIDAAFGIADLTEWDVRVTSDGAFVLMHDATVDRTTNGTGAVSSLTLAQIKALDAGSWFSSAFIGEKVPTLSEAVDAALLGGLTPLIEPKAGSASVYHNEFVTMGLAPTAFRLISFDWNFLDSLDALNTNYNLGALGSGTLTQSTINTVKAQGADFLDWEHSTITQAVVDLVHANGMELHIWTVNSSARMQQLIDFGVDGITTDLPETLNQLVIFDSRTADLNMDTQVNADDWLMYNSGRGVDLSGLSKTAAYQMGDMDGDFDNDIADFVRFKELYLAAAAPVVSELLVTVPEPMTGMLLLLAVLGILGRGRLLSRAKSTKHRYRFNFQGVAILGSLALLPFLAGTASATVLNFAKNEFGAVPANNTDLTIPYGSNVTAANIIGATAGAEGFTSNIALTWAPTGGTVPLASDIDILEFHSSTTFSGAGFTVPVLQFDMDLSGHSVLPADPTIDFNVSGGKALQLNSFKIGNATDQIEPAYSWTINLIRLSDMTTVATRTTGLLSAGSLETVSFNFTGTTNEDYRLHFNDGGANAVRSAIDDLSFAEIIGGVTPQLKLVVSTTTGQVELVNNSGQSFTIDSYEITSAFDSLDPVGWNSLQESDFEGNGVPGTGNGWEEAPEVGAGQLIESYLLGSSTIADGASIPLGGAFDFDKLNVQQDLQFGYHIAGTGGFLTAGGVEYISPVLDADFDNDGDVDGKDLLTWQRGFGLTGAAATNAAGNADGDTDIDSQDLAAWQIMYGTGGSLVSASTTVPEPATWSFGLLGMTIRAISRKSRRFTLET